MSTIPSYDGSEPYTTPLTPIDLVMPRNYVVGANLCFPISRRVDIREIYEHLCTGFREAIKQIPSMGGFVAPSGSPGKYHIVTPAEAFTDKQIVFNDIRSGTENPWPHSYKSLKKANFPPELVSSIDLTPVKEYMKRENLPVLATQANFIDGGLILSMSLLHTAGDALTWNNFSTFFAAHVKASWPDDESEPPEKVQPALLDRSPLMEGNPGVQAMDIREYKMQAANATLEDPRKHLIDGPPSSIADMEIGYFSISDANLNGLRDAICEGSETYVTVNDALAAMIWVCVNRARISEDPSFKGNLAVAYDGRPVVNPAMPSKYMGNCSLAFPINLHTHPASVYDAALAISEARNEFTNKHIRDVIGYLGSLDDMTEERVKYAQTVDPTLVISNLKDMAFYKYDWGPNMGFTDSLRLTLPLQDCIPRVFPLAAQRDGTVELIAWIEKTAMDRLRKDEFWSKWTKEVYG